MLEREIFVECQAVGCASVLQVAVPPTHRQGNGEVLVRCGKCHRLLRVQLPHELLESALPPVPEPTTQLAQPHRPPGSSPAQQRLQHPLEYRHHDEPQHNHQRPQLPQHRQGRQPEAIPQTPDHTTAAPGLVSRRRRAPSAYQEFIGQEMKRLKTTHPDLDHASAFKLAASSWVTSDVKAAADQAQGEQQLSPQPNSQPAEEQQEAPQQPLHMHAPQQHGSSAQGQAQAQSLPTAPTQYQPQGGVEPNATAAAPFDAETQQHTGNIIAGRVKEEQQPMQPGATPGLTAMLPPAARVASNSSDAVNSHQSAATGPSLDPQAAPDSTAVAASGGEVQVTSAPLTLEQTWRTLCNEHAPTDGTALLQQQQQQPSACTATPFAAGPACVFSEGSDLASWSSGMTAGQAGHTAADHVLASPGALSGSAANSMPNILRHNSAPITTAVALVPRQSKPVGYSITTAGPGQSTKR